MFYLTTSTPDITFVVLLCARYQAKPKASHLKYIDGTCDYGILYSHDTNSILVGYCDAYWARSVDEIKNTYGECFFLGKKIKSHGSTRSKIVSHYLLQRLSTFLQGEVALNCFG